MVEKSNEKFKDGNYDEAIELSKKAKEQNERIEVLQRKIKRLRKSLDEESEEKQEPSKRIISFNDSDLDSGLNTTVSVEFLEKKGLPLPSTIKNLKYNVIKAYQKRAEELLTSYHGSLTNSADFSVEGGISKATAKKKNPKSFTLRDINYYNILGEYVNNINKLVNIAKKKKQDKVSFTSITLFNSSRDLNYLLAPFLLETME